MRVSLLKSGFTMVEVLVSLLIVSVALAAIAPALAISVLSRVHSQRLEQAGFLARQELDRVRSIVDGGKNNIKTRFNELPRIPGEVPMGADGTLFTGGVVDFSAPFSNVAPPLSLDKSTVQCWRRDQPNQLVDCDVAAMAAPKTQYVIQLFRDPGLPCLDAGLDPIRDASNTYDVPCFFNMTVRVYHINSFDRTTRKPYFFTEWSAASAVALEPYLNPVPPVITGAKSLATIQRSPLVVLTGEVGSVAALADYCRNLAPDPDTECKPIFGDI
jgi:prepilin-type N-terminal cleavage/methylation domain-containing protein